MKGLMKKYFKIEFLTLKIRCSASQGRWSARPSPRTTRLSITLFAFDKDEEISTHASGGDALSCLEESEK